MGQKTKPKIRYVNRLRISKGHDGVFRVRSPEKPYPVLKEAPTFDKAYKWAHRNRKYAAKEPPWTEDELEYVADHYGRIPVEDICRRLNRSHNSVKIITVRKLGINLKSNIYTSRAVAKEMGVSCSKTIVAWYDRGYLAGKPAPFVNGPNKVWFFDYDDIIACITQRPWLCDLKRMPQSYFRSIVQAEWKRDPWYTRIEAAEFLGLGTVGPIWRYLKAGWLHGVRRPSGGGKGAWIFRHSALAEFQLNDPRPDHRKSATLAQGVRTAMETAERKAFKALGRGRWAQFSQWANVWDNLNYLNYRVPSPFKALRDYANSNNGRDDGQDDGEVRNDN